MEFKKVTLTKNEGFYFPLYNLKGLKSTVTPNLLGDVKLNYHSFLNEPISELGLFESYGRHVIFQIDNINYYLSGKGLYQQDDTITLTYGGMYQHILRQNKKYNIEVTSFIPLYDNIELHEITYKNITNTKQKIKVITAIPLYGRSADNIFDHRHVTSLLNRVKAKDQTILLNPTLSFDERGHHLNKQIYGFLTQSPDLALEGFYPIYDTFINGGSLLFPKGYDNIVKENSEFSGYEALGGASYKEITLSENETFTFYIGLAIDYSEDIIINYNKLLNKEIFNQKLNESIRYFDTFFNDFQVTLKDQETTEFLSFIAIQPELRRLFGNSYLPHHDYGKGGKGWRDLFQDLLYMIMSFNGDVKEILINNFKGVRIDGSNATIIGDCFGEFKADRNNITRIWSDHAVWPLLTLYSYINYFNDYDILFEKVSYFEDQFTHYTNKVDYHYPEDNKLRNNGEVYQGTILEHIILQNIIGSLNLGKHGFVKLENADWNDGLDMAKENGETIAFTHFYINNLKIIIEILQNYETIELFDDLGNLILNIEEQNDLNEYFDKVANFNSKVKNYKTKTLIDKINYQIDKLSQTIKDKAFMNNGALQSYIDNDGNFLDKNTVSLTGQAMALLNKTITSSQAKQIAKITKQRLYNSDKGGYHLNENYNEIKLNMGRAYGFSYNHKENGAVFSHMALMYAYGLYEYNLVDYGHEALHALINRAKDQNSKVALGIPEYFNDLGEGKYLYLTGSATWLIKTIKEQLFGLTMKDGVLYLNPKLAKTDFYNKKASIKTKILGENTTLTVYNLKDLDFNEYQIKEIRNGGKVVKNGITKIKGKLEVYLDVKN